MGTEPIVALPINDDGTSQVDATDQIPRTASPAESAPASTLTPRRATWSSPVSRAAQPAELERTEYGYRRGATARGLTAADPPQRSQLIANSTCPSSKAFEFPGADGDRVHGWLVRPPGFDPAKKYPVVFLIHGGPQGAWHDEWHNRWNYQMFAAPGYAVVAINPRGSTGYGQKFTDQISQDWTGRVYEDLMKGLDHALAKYLVSGRHASGGLRRLVRRLHGQLDRRAHRSVQGADQPRRGLRPDKQVRHDRGTLVPRVGIRRAALGEARALSRAVAQQRLSRTSRRRRW